ncbi:MAG: hypothetical protein HQL31_01185 [Planctomycetes bacterium]|nr:hypothetical protein [Planctomycetota bacterium]
MKISDDRAFAFLESLQQGLEYYQKIQALGKEQKLAIAGNDQLGLLKVMQAKQKFIDRVERLVTGFTEERTIMSSCSLGEFSSIDAELDRVLAETEILLRDLTEAEAEDVETLAEMQKQNNQEMDHLGRGKGMVKAYKARSSFQPSKFETSS